MFDSVEENHFIIRSPIQFNDVYEKCLIVSKKSFSDSINVGS